MSIERVVVFLDWQNVYRRARGSFHDDTHAPASCGQVDPVDLALTLTERGAPESVRELKQVRIYRGMPDQKFDPTGYAAARRQIANWTRNNKVAVFPRTLRYPDGWKPGHPGESPREKGVDVELAVDLVGCAIDGEFDTGIVMSSDQDLNPALEYLSRTRARHRVRVEVAAWKGDHGRRPNRIGSAVPGTYCHWLGKEDYWGLEDETDYTVSSSSPSSDGRPRPRPPGHFRDAR